MTTKTVHELEHIEEILHIEENVSCEDLFQELSRRLDAVWRYDHYIANASVNNQAHLREFWSLVKSQAQENIRQLKQYLLAQHIKNACF